MRRVIRLYHTLRPLRARQWYWRMWLPVKRMFYIAPRRAPDTALNAARMLPRYTPLTFPADDRIDFAAGEATLLNIRQSFPPRRPPYESRTQGLLWAFHLGYMEWLAALPQPGALDAMIDYAERERLHWPSAMAYPTALRVQQWISVLVDTDQRDDRLLNALYIQAHRLAAFPEYHLDANHLLEGALARCRAAVFFGESRWKEAAQTLLAECLEDQILSDGAHYERSASYHTALLSRILLLLETIQQSPERARWRATERLLHKTCSKMLGWLAVFLPETGPAPAFGDCVSGDVIPLDVLESVAAKTEVLPTETTLADSGYRIAKGNGWRAWITASAPAPTHQPGHSHADAGSFCLHFGAQPLIVDTGISTYERSARRLIERSTAAHNTVSIGGTSSSDVWASFRVGRRARIGIMEDVLGELTVRVEARGVHTRRFSWTDGAFCVFDTVQKNTKNWCAYLHFHPNVTPVRTANGWHAGSAEMSFDGTAEIALEQYEWAAGFNDLRPAWRLRATPTASSLSTTIRFRSAKNPPHVY